MLLSIFRALLVLAAVAHTATGSVTTLYAIDQNIPTPTLSGTSIEIVGTTIASALGSDLYPVEIIHSAVIVHEASTTQTIDSIPITITETVSENASRLQINVLPTIAPDYRVDGAALDCTLDRSKSTGQCVDVVAAVSLGQESSGGIVQLISTTYTTTWTGSFVPIATVTVSSATSIGGANGLYGIGGLQMAAAALSAITLLCGMIV